MKDNSTGASGRSSKTPALPSNLKSKNRRLILACFRDQQEHTVADITDRTGISKLTVMRAIQFFCGKHILVSAGKGESTEQGGKKPEYFRLACNRYLLSITMWPTNLNLTLFNMNLWTVASYAYEWIIPATPEEAFFDIRQRAQELMEKVGISVSDLYGVNLSTAGIVDYDNLVLKYSVHSPGWGANVPLGRYMQEIFGEGPVFLIENAGRCTSRAALDAEENIDKRILVLFTSWGLSASLIQSGNILSGRDSLIGEIGHMILDPHDTEQCSCGSYGCAERLVSEDRVLRRIQEAPPPAGSPLSQFPLSQLNLRHLFAASQQGDPYAQAHVAYLAEKFAALIRNVSLVFNPETVIFVGNYAVAGTYFDRQVKAHLAEFHYQASSAPIELKYDVRSLTDLDARGGALALMNHFFDSASLYQD